jgi:hypothetical protein
VNVKIDPPSPPKHPPSPHLKKAKPLDGLQRDRPQAVEQFSRVCEAGHVFSMIRAPLRSVILAPCQLTPTGPSGSDGVDEQIFGAK